MFWNHIRRTAVCPAHLSMCAKSFSSISETATAALRKGFEKSTAEDCKLSAPLTLASSPMPQEHPYSSSSSSSSSLPDLNEATPSSSSSSSSFLTDEETLAPKIVVVGVGGGGCNAVNNMISKGLSGVHYVVANTDAQHLKTSLTQNRVQLGQELTFGLGCGANPEMGQLAAQDSLEDVLAAIGADANMVFLAAGMGGGTGTGATPVIARATRAADILTVAVVTKPFRFEGSHRLNLAQAGLDELQQAVDTMIVIPNQNLFHLSTAQTSLFDAFTMADHVLLNGVKNITDLMVQPGLINLDFADVQSVMSNMGHAIMGAGEAEGENRALNAAEAALSNPLLGEMSVQEARGLLVNITGGSDMTLFEVDEAANRITQEVKDPMANIIFGSTYDRAMEGKIRVSVVATGVSDPCASQDEHQDYQHSRHHQDQMAEQ